jgi:CelD/BcsL family acetyltransferase involved in cellulose biosynthesis
MTIRVSEPVSTAAPGGVRVVRPAPRPVWEQVFASDPDAVATQSPAWIDSLSAARGCVDVSRLYEMPDGRRLVLPLAATVRAGVRMSEESWPYGWGYGGLLAEGGAADREIAVVLADLARRPAVRAGVTPMPLQAARWDAAAPARALRVPFTTRVIDLQDGFDAVWKHYRRSGRSRTRKAEKLGVEIHRASGADAAPALAEFTRLYRGAVDKWARQRGQPLRIARLLAAMRDVPGQAAAVAARLGEHCVVWTATTGGQTLGVDVMLQSAGHHMSWLGAIDADLARSTAGTYLLQTRVIEDACARGVRYMHLGESDPNSGVDEFKAAFGSTPVPYSTLRFERVPLSRAEHGLRAAFAAVSSWTRRREES